MTFKRLHIYFIQKIDKEKSTQRYNKKIVKQNININIKHDIIKIMISNQIAGLIYNILQPSLTFYNNIRHNFIQCRIYQNTIFCDLLNFASHAIRFSKV